MFIFTYYIFTSRIHFKLLLLPLLRKDSNIRKNYCCDKNLNFSRFRVTNFRIEICYLAMRTQYLHIHKQNMFGHFSSSICSHTRALVSILNSLVLVSHSLKIINIGSAVIEKKQLVIYSFHPISPVIFLPGH